MYQRNPARGSKRNSHRGSHGDKPNGRNSSHYNPKDESQPKDSHRKMTDVLQFEGIQPITVGQYLDIVNHMPSDNVENLYTYFGKGQDYNDIQNSFGHCESYKAILYGSSMYGYDNVYTLLKCTPHTPAIITPHIKKTLSLLKWTLYHNSLKKDYSIFNELVGGIVGITKYFMEIGATEICNSVGIRDINI
jgi:hypothetical protein